MTRDIEQLIARDIALCRAMTDELEDYLKSDVLFWEPNRNRPGGELLPKLTPGGFLLALRHLRTLQGRLRIEQIDALERAEQTLAKQKSQWRLRYGPKLARDLRSRLDTWDWYLEDLEKRPESAVIHYPREVETRAKIDLLLRDAHQIEWDADKKQQRLAALDERLRACFVPGDFCWLEALAPGFPRDRFWYLWGRPQDECD
jgi:hypothetical protein